MFIVYNKEDKDMKFAKQPKSTLARWLCLVIPIVNLYGLWKLAKIWANIEEERGD
jgi:hypothetical protein